MNPHTKTSLIFLVLAVMVMLVTCGVVLIGSRISESRAARVKLESST